MREGQPVGLRTWCGEVVGVESAGGQHWFLPAAGVALVLNLYLAWFGLGVLLWALFFGRWDGWLLLAFRLFAWFFIAAHPANVAADALVYGFDRGEIGRSSTCRRWARSRWWCCSPAAELAGIAQAAGTSPTSLS